MTSGFKTSILSRQIAAGWFTLACAAVVPACAVASDDETAGPPAGDTATSSAALSAPGGEPSDAEFVVTPVGRFHQSCVHGVGLGATIHAGDQVTLRNGSTQQFAPCGFQPRDTRRSRLAAQPASRAGSGRVPVADGWAEFDSAFMPTNGYGYDWANALYGSWTVPLAPRQYSGQTVFLFTSGEPSDGSAIIQPVLQYGPSAAGGGNFWSEAVWYISSSNNVFFGTLQRVNVGDTINGYMTGHDCSGGGVCTWDLEVWDGNVGSVMNIATGETFRWMTKGVLEVYGISNCNKLPTEGDTGATFYNVHAYMPGPNTTDFNDVTTSMGWTGSVFAEGCSFGVIDTSDGVQLFWD